MGLPEAPGCGWWRKFRTRLNHDDCDFKKSGNGFPHSKSMEGFMIKRPLLVYFVSLSIPVLLILVSWQSARYVDLEREITLIEKEQEEWVESNNRLIAAIAILSSSERIEYISQNQLGLGRVKPEDVLQIRISGDEF
jgi:cell division protein FtsL